jgi:hypothetical protein
MPRGAISANAVQGALRRKEILELRTKGFSTAAIAERLSIIFTRPWRIWPQKISSWQRTSAISISPG